VAGAAGVGDDHRNQQVLERDIAVDLIDDKPARCRDPVIPGWSEGPDPESRDSPMCNCTSEVRALRAPE
jgi:hypothetical protein